MDNWIVTNPDRKPCLNTGYRLYMIGGQDGSFPERGEHMPYEMWGVWMPPVKLLGGYWFLIDGALAEKAQTYEQLPYGAAFTFETPGQWKLHRFEYVPREEKGLVIRATLENLSGSRRTFRLDYGVQSDLMPVWLSERAGIADGKDKAAFDADSNALTLTDGANPWTVQITSDLSMTPVEGAQSPEPRRESDLKCYAQLSGSLTLEAGEQRTVTFLLAASENGAADAAATMARLRTGHEAMLEEKKAASAAMAKKASLHFAQKPVLEQMYRWNQYINDWIIRKVTDIGEGLVAGYAEFPWWFGNDTNYIVPAELMQGNYEICKQTLRLVRRKSEEINGNGRVVHEISSNGVVYYEGMTTETPQFAETVWDVYRWSGDRAFLEEMYDFCVQGMDWIAQNSEDGLPRGYGISEIAGLDCFCCDTALLAVRGYEILARMSGALGKTEAESAYRARWQESWDRFRKEFYLPELGIYGDMVATREEMIPRADAWKYTLNSFPITEEEKIMGESSCKHDKSPKDREEKQRLRRRMEGVIAQAEAMAPGSRKAFYLFGFEHSLITAEFGYLQGKEAQDLYEAQRAVSRREKLAVENMMPIGHGREIAGFGNMNRLDLILSHMDEVAEGFGKVMPGATNEIYPEQGCFVQAWNSLATMWPYANSIFGIRPDAAKRTVALRPCVGPAVDGLRLENLVIGGEYFTFTYEHGVLRAELPDGRWRVILERPAENFRLEVVTRSDRRADA